MKAEIIVVSVILAILAILFGATMYSENMRYDCINAAMQNKYAAVEIQAICK